MAAKLIAYGVEICSPRLTYAYLTNRRLRTKVGNKYSSSRDLLSGVLQGLILGPLFFSSYFCDLFLLVYDTDTANYADGTTPYVSDDKISAVLASLERSANLMFNWFTDNQIKGNDYNCHVLLGTDETLQVKLVLHL